LTYEPRSNDDIKNLAKPQKEQREIVLKCLESPMQRVISLKTDRHDQMPPLLLEDWRRFLHEHDRARGTIKKYTQAVAHFLAWYEQEERMPLQLAALTPIALIGYRNHLQHEQHKSISTINLRISALRTWCAWLVDEGYLPLDPAARVKLLGGETGSKREGLEPSQINALLRQAQISRDPARNYAIVQVLFQTGIRLSECSGLTFGDITFGERSGLLLVRAGKGNKVRSVPLNASAREALSTYVAPRLGVGKPSIKAISSQWPNPRSEQAHSPIFESQKGGALTTSAMGQMIDDLVTAAGELVPQKTSAHTLRHTFAHHYLAQYPGDVVGLATLLGHSSLDTTRLYSQPTVSQLSTRVEQLKINAYAR
jgi:site-specific recombinase XerD